VARRLLPIAEKLADQGFVLEAWDYVSRNKANVRQGDGYPALILKLASELMQRGVAKEGLEAYRQAVEVNPQSAAARFGLGVALVEVEGAVAQALPHLQQAAKLDPKHIDARQTLAWVLATSEEPSLRNPREAIRWAKEAVSLAGQDDPSQLDTLAVAHAALGDFERAMELEQKALKLARSSRQDIVPLLESRIESFRNKRPILVGSGANP
jgi:tetratricopeptide (TPR) repeat protein